MAKRVHIRTSRNTQSVNQLIRNLPTNISSNTQLGRAFRARMIHEIMSRLHKAFMEKSKGRRDEFGNRWQPLSPATVRRKTSSGSSGQSALTKSQQRLFQKSFNAALNQLRRAGLREVDAVTKARRTAWDMLATGGTNVPIGIDSGRLERSLRPGKTGSTYQPPAEQKVDFSSGRLRVSTAVPYARHFSARRPITPKPRDMLKWLKEGVQTAIEKTVTEHVKRD